MSLSKKPARGAFSARTFVDHRFGPFSRTRSLRLRQGARRTSSPRFRQGSDAARSRPSASRPSTGGWTRDRDGRTGFGGYFNSPMSLRLMRRSCLLVSRANPLIEKSDAGHCVDQCLPTQTNRAGHTGGPAPCSSQAPGTRLRLRRKGAMAGRAQRLPHARSGDSRCCRRFFCGSRGQNRRALGARRIALAGIGLSGDEHDEESEDDGRHQQVADQSKVAGNQGGSESENDDDFDHGWNGLHSFMRNSVPHGITPAKNSPHGVSRRQAAGNALRRPHENEPCLRSRPPKLIGASCRSLGKLFQVALLPAQTQVLSIDPMVRRSRLSGSANPTL